MSLFSPHSASVSRSQLTSYLPGSRPSHTNLPPFFTNLPQPQLLPLHILGTDRTENIVPLWLFIVAKRTESKTPISVVIFGPLFGNSRRLVLHYHEAQQVSAINSRLDWRRGLIENFMYS
jgi:hypothetical protein